MQRLLAEIKNFVFKNLMAFIVLAVSAFLLVLVLLWVSFLVIWNASNLNPTSVQVFTTIVAAVIFTVFAAAALLYFVNKARLDRAKAAAIELELAQNLVLINGYRQAVLDYEAASSGKN